MQSKERTITVNTVFILPMAMIIFSLFGALSIAVNIGFSIGVWAIGAIMSVLVALKIGAPDLAISNDSMFILGISLLYGSFSGIFLARSLIMRKAAKVSTVDFLTTTRCRERRSP